MAVTFEELNALVRRRLGDTTAPYKWSDTQINQWINDAIADYTNVFPRTSASSIATQPDVQQYSLPSDFLSALRVEYPAGSHQYLKRRSCTHPHFWDEAGYYDILRRGSADETDTITISTRMDGTNTIALTYHAAHLSLEADSDETTVPEHHLELLVLFCRWKAWEMLSTEEGANPDPSKLLAATHEVNAYRAERAYRKALEEYQAAASESGFAHWRMDRFDPLV